MSWTDGFKCDWCGKITLTENSEFGEFVKTPGITKLNDGREKHRYAVFCNHYYFTSAGEPKIFCSAKCKHECGDRDELETPEQAQDRLNKDFDGLQPLNWLNNKVNNKVEELKELNNPKLRTDWFMISLLIIMMVIVVYAEFWL